MFVPLRGSSLHGNILYVGNRSSLRDLVYLGSFEFFAFAETFVVLFLRGVELVVVLFDLLVDVLVNRFVFSLSALCVFDVFFIWLCHVDALRNMSWHWLFVSGNSNSFIPSPTLPFAKKLNDTVHLSKSCGLVVT